MTIKIFAADLREVIRSIRDEHHVSAVKCDDLIALLDKVLVSPGEETSPLDIERHKAELQAWVKKNEAFHSQRLEMFRSVITSGQNALKTAFLMNGSATVALLAFLGKLSDQHQDKIAVFSSSLFLFVIGVLVITVASGSIYLTQWLYSRTKPWMKTAGHVLNILTILLSASSYGLFIWGAITAYRAFLGF